MFEFYSQFLEEFSKKKTQVLQSLQKEIKEYADLAGWKSRNYLILKETCEKFRKKVNRISRKYQEILQQSLDDFLLNSLRNDLLHENPHSFLNFVEEVYKNREEFEERALFQGRKFKEIAKKHEIFSKAFRLLRKTSFLLQKMCYYEENPVKTLKNPGNEQGFASSAQFLQDLLQQLISRIRDLQRENSTKLMKFRGLQDLFKNLKEIGLNSATRGRNSALIYEFEFESLEIEAKDAETATFSKNSEVFQDFFETFAEKIAKNRGNRGKCQDNQRIFLQFYQESEKYYYKILDRILVFRSKNDFHKDLGLANINKGIGFVLEMFYAIRAHFSVFFAVFKEFKLFNSYRRLFLQIQGIHENGAEKNASFLINKRSFAVFATELAKFKRIAGFFCDLETEFQEMQDFFIEKHEFLKKIEEFLLTLQAGKELISRVFCEEELFFSCEDLEKIQEFIEKTAQNLQNLEKSLDLLVSDSKIQYLITKKIERNYKEITENVLEIFKETFQTILEEAQTQRTSSNLNSEEKYCEFLTHCQVNIQKITRISAEYKENLDNFCFSAENASKTSFLSNETALLSQYLAILKQIVKEACVLHSIFARVPVIFKENLENIGVCLHFSSLLYKHCESVLFHSLEFLASFSRFSSFVAFLLTNLFYKGFCQPKDEENQDLSKENEQNLEDLVEGTGIGEGKGQENVSKEIEFEEQVLGTQGNQEKTQENERNEEEEEGIQMENDFEGENFEEKREKQEKEEKTQQEGKEDDEFSQVDEEIDYDLWNKEQGDEEEEEKLSQMEEEKEQRKLEELDLQGEEQGDSELRAKQGKKDKENTRNLKEFDKNQEEINAEEFAENEQQEPGEQEEEFNENEGNQESLEAQPVSVEKSEKMSLDFEGDQRENDGESMENEEDLQENEEFQDPLEKKEELNEESFEKSQKDNKEDLRNNEEREREIQEEDAMDLEKEEEEKEKEEIPISSGVNPKENKEKNYGVKDFKGGDQDINENSNTEENKDARGAAEMQSKNIGKELDKEKKGENSSFSQEFLKAVIEHSREMFDQAQMEKFVKDLNVVRETEQENINEINANINNNEQEIEYEAIEQRNCQEKGLVTNLPNIQEKEREGFLEDEEKNKENGENKENNQIFSKSGKRDMQDETEENDNKEKENQKKNKPFKTEKKSNLEGKEEEDFEKNKEKKEYLMKKEGNYEDFTRKKELENKGEDKSLSNYFNSKKTQEERKQEIVELIKEWKLNQGNYEKSMQV